MVRFDKPCLRIAGAVEYFREHMVGDYLTERGQVQMVWHGEGAARLGLSGPCRMEDFEALCAGRHPATGDKLMVRDKGAHRRVCFFAQISAPKDVSIAHLVGGDARIAGWWNDAVRETLREIEAVTATRVRRDGANEDRPTGNMVAAVVTHDANRALDPQLHTHVCVMNLTFDASEDRWKSVQPSAFYRHQGYFREVCYNKLAERLVGAGYELEQVRGIGFNIAGFPPELRERFSKRRREILRQAAATGATSQDEMQTITARSRAGKTKATAADLRAGWINEAGDLLAKARATIAAANSSARGRPGTEPAAAVASAEAHVFERRSVVDERVLLREALIAGRGYVTLDDLKTAQEQRISSGELLRQGADVASRESLKSEDEFVTWAEANRSGQPPLGQASGTEGLAADQASAVAGVMGSRSRLVIFQGDAGTGKTTSLKHIVEGIERSGGRVFGCAPSAGATDVLRKELTADADTLKQLLVNPALQQATRGRVLIVDEAGLVSVREMRDLCRLAEANDNRLVLVGDIKQHNSVEAGDAVRCLQKYARVPVVRLTEIRRQKDPRYRAAVARLARGDAFGAFNRFVRLGAVYEERHVSRLLGEAADDYVRTTRAGQSCLAISPVWTEIHAFTKEVRTRLKAIGAVAPEDRVVPTVFPLKWTAEERRRIANYHAGDVLTFHRSGHGYENHEYVTVVRRENESLVVRRSDGSERRLNPRKTTGYEVGLAKDLDLAVGDRLLVRANLKPCGLKNGDLVEVAGWADDGGIKLKDGRSIPHWFRQFSHGYASTSHSAQGKTVDRGILIMAEEGIAAGNLKQAYVSNSRFRESQMIYTTDTKAAREAMQRPGDRMLASELVTRAKPASSYRRFFLSRLYRGRVRPSAKAMLRGYRLNTRFARFVNVPELMQTFRQMADIQTADMLKLPVPELDGGKPRIARAPATPALKMFVASLAERAEKLKTTKVDPRDDNMLKITGEGRKAALDIRLVVPAGPDHPESKANLAVREILAVWQETRAHRLTQMVFCDLSTPKTQARGLSVYQDVKAKLVSLGVPAAEIQFIQDHDSDAAKSALFKDVRSGKVRILMGSTQKMGAGTNVQAKLVALHHLDAPWRPADIEQREGRIRRQGNSNATVRILRYVTEGSFDAYSWQLLETKAKFIAQVMTGHSTARRIEDLDSPALTYAEVKAIASGNPLVIEKAKVDSEVMRLSRLRAEHQEAQYSGRNRIRMHESDVARLERHVAGMEQDLTLRRDTSGEKFEMTVDGQKFTERAKAGAALIYAVEDHRTDHLLGRPQTATLGEVGGFKIEFRSTNADKINLRGTMEYSANVSPSPVGIVSSLEHAARGIDEQLSRCREDLACTKSNLAELTALSGKDFEHEERYRELIARQAELVSKLDLTKNQASSQQGAEPTGEVESKPETGESETPAVERKPAELMSPKEFREAGLGTANDVAVLSALRERKPVSALAVDEYNLKHALPRGYRRDGEFFIPPSVKLSIATKPHSTESPAETPESVKRPVSTKVARRRCTEIKLSA